MDSQLVWWMIRISTNGGSWCKALRAHSCEFPFRRQISFPAHPDSSFSSSPSLHHHHDEYHDDSDGGYFPCILTFPKEYPDKPPEMRFTTKGFWHPNGKSHPIHRSHSSSCFLQLISVMIVPCVCVCMCDGFLSVSGWSRVHFHPARSEGGRIQSTGTHQ